MLLKQLQNQVSEQFAMLVVSVVRTVLLALPANILDQIGKVEELCNMWEGLLAAWKLKIPKEKDAFTEVLSSMLAVIRCGLANDSEKPSVAAVRQARRNLMHAVQQKSASVGGLAKTLAYDGLAHLMKKAQDFAAIGIGDEAATKRCTAAVDQLEEQFDLAFSDIHAFIATGAGDGAPHTLATYPGLLQAVGATVVEVSLSLQRWSAAALKENQELMEDSIANCISIYKSGSFMLVNTLHDAVAPMAHPVECSTAEGHEGEGVANHNAAEVAGAAGADMSAMSAEAKDVVTTQPAASHCKGEVMSQQDHDTSTLQELAGAVHSIAKPIAEFAASLAQLVEELLQVVKTAVTRLGTQSPALIARQDELLCFSHDLHNNAGTMVDIASYITNAAILDALPTVEAMSKSPVAGAANEKHLEALRTFCAIHQVCAEEDGVYDLMLHDFPVDKEDMVASISARLDVLVRGRCSAIYELHTKNATEFWVNSIQQSLVQTNAISDEVAADVKPESLLPRLLFSPTWSELAGEQRLCLGDDVAAREIFQSCTHQKALRELTAFLDVVGLVSIRIPDLKLAGSAGTEPILAAWDSMCLA